MTNKAYYTFGRHQPPTIGHGEMITQMTEAANNDGADHFVFLSQSHDTRRNPIPLVQKAAFMEALFPDANIISENTNVITPFHAAMFLDEAGYTDVKMFAGGDRADVFRESISAYIGHPDPTKAYHFEHFDVVNVGSRLDEDSVSQASGTKAREAVINNDMETFAAMIPTNETLLIEAIFNAIRYGLEEHTQSETMRNLLTTLQ